MRLRLKTKAVIDSKTMYPVLLVIYLNIIINNIE